MSKSLDYTTLKTELKPKPIILTNQLALTTRGPGIYEATLTGGKLVLDAGWVSSLTGKYVVFIPGNLYIDSSSNLTVVKDGKSIITFIVQNNMGIDPDESKIDGAYITEGIFDTVCEQINGFIGSTCEPSSSSIAAGTSPLTLDGLFISNGGFLLDRKGTPGTSPGETFTFRPDFLLSGIDTIGQIQLTWKENTSL